MRRIPLFLLAFWLLALPAAAHELLVVQSVRNAMYDEALAGFRSACPAGSRTLVLSDYADPELARVLHEERPRLVLALGDGALAALHGIHRIPVLALMALGLPRQEGGSGNLAAVDLFVKPEQYLTLFKKLKARRVGVLYDPARTGWYLKLARAAARQHGIELVLREAATPRQAIAQLGALKGSVDALWVLPDAGALNREALEACFLFSQGQSIPVVSFSAAHLKLGALAVLEIDRAEAGRQAGELAQLLLRGTAPAELGIVPPRRVSVKVNEAVARRLGYPDDVIRSLGKR